MYIVDMHCDSLLTVSGECGLVNNYNYSQNHPQLQFDAMFCPKGSSSPEERRRKIIQYLNVYLSECERLGLAQVKCGRDVFRVTDDGVRAALLSIEGGGGLFADSEELRMLCDAGLSVFGLAWDNNELSASAWDDIDTGLTEEGRRMISHLSDKGVIIDVSHMSDRSFYETLELTSMPVVATHSNFRDICPSPRNLTLNMAEKIAARGGVIGINIYPPFLKEESACMDDVLRHIDYGLERLGEYAIGFGFDIDGTDGRYPIGIDINRSIHDQVIDMLLSHYSHSTVERIAGLNVIDFLKNNLP